MGGGEERKQNMEQEARDQSQRVDNKIYQGDLLSTGGPGIIPRSWVHSFSHSQLPAQTRSPALPVSICESPGPGVWAEPPFPVSRAKAHGWTGDSWGDWWRLWHPAGCPQGNCAAGENRATAAPGQGSGRTALQGGPSHWTLPLAVASAGDLTGSYTKSCLQESLNLT